MSVVYEGVILFGVVFFFGYAFSALTQFKGSDGPLRYSFQAWMFAILGVYFTYFWSNGRRTLPMKTMSVVLVDRNDQPISTVRALARYVAASTMLAAVLAAMHSLSAWFALALIIPFVPTVFDTRRRTLYDLVCGTRLVVAPVRRPVAPDPKPAN